MSAEIDALLREMDILLTDLRETLHNINNFNADDRRQKLSRCQRCIQQIRTTKEAALLEARSLESPTEREEAKDALKRRMGTFKQLCEDYDYKRNEIDRDQLQAEAETYETDPQVATQALIAKGDRLQDQTQDAISRMHGLAVEAEDVGIATAVKIDAQMEQMQRIGEGLDDVAYNTERAKQTAMAMARGAAKDLCIQILCGGIVLCTVVIIVLISV